MFEKTICTVQELQKLDHGAVICKSKFQKNETVAHVTIEEQEDYLFVEIYFSTKKFDFLMIDSDYTNHMTYEINIFKKFNPMENKSNLNEKDIKPSEKIQLHQFKEGS